MMDFDSWISESQWPLSGLFQVVNVGLNDLFAIKADDPEGFII